MEPKKRPKAPNKQAGRPRALLDWAKIDELLVAGCKGVGVADILGIHPDTLYNAVQERYKTDFSAYSQQKREHGNCLIQQKQFEMALGGDRTLLIWLGKQRLGQGESGTGDMENKNLPTPADFLSIKKGQFPLPDIELAQAMRPKIIFTTEPVGES